MRPFFSCAYELPILQPVSFQIHACNGGCTPCFSASRPLIARFLIPYPFCFQILAHSSALFCTLQIFNSLVFNRFHTLRQKHNHRGCGGGGAMLNRNPARISVLTSLLHYILTSSRQREQHRLGRRIVGNGFQFRVVSPPRLPHLHLPSLQNAYELPGAYHRFSPQVIVCHHHSFVRP